MSITIKKYIDIDSGVAAASAVSRRELMQRIFTTNVLVPVNTSIEITTLKEVGDFFGETSEEYKRAVNYFGFISKSITKNDVISFAGYSTVPVAARINGKQQAQSLAELTAYTTAEMTLTMGGIGGSTGPSIDLSSSASISDAMTAIQVALRALDVSVLFTTLTVTYDPVGKRVTMVSGANGENAIVLTSATAGFLETLGWAIGAGISDGTVGDTITSALAISDSLSDNFGSYLFAETLLIDAVIESAAWNHDKNVKYIYMVPVSAANSQLWHDALNEYSGTALTLNTGASDDYSESIPGILLGATNYDGVNSVINYMYQVVPYPISVNDTSTSDAFDELDINYNGQTQAAGDKIFFYQRGKLMGSNTAPLDMNVYANEIWFKDAITVSLINLLLALERVPANTSGRLTITSTINGVISNALRNGTISIGKTLTDLQRAAVKAITGNDEAASQVQNAGYWLNVEFVKEGSDTNAVYTLVYSKDDVVRTIEGSQILI
jgi:hypothetical protein